jgi:hypothetical protein
MVIGEPGTPQPNSKEGREAHWYLPEHQRPRGYASYTRRSPARTKKSFVVKKDHKLFSWWTIQLSLSLSLFHVWRTLCPDYQSTVPPGFHHTHWHPSNEYSGVPI